MNKRASHKVHCSEVKIPPSFFSLLLDLCTFQHAAAINSMANPTTSSPRDTTLVWCSVLKVKVTPVPAMPITSEMTPKGNTQRYHDFSVPPVAWASRSRVERSSVALGTRIGAEPSGVWLKSWSSVGSCTKAGGWQGNRPAEQPISELQARGAQDDGATDLLKATSDAVPSSADTVRMWYSWQWSIYRAGWGEDESCNKSAACCDERKCTHFLCQAVMCSLLSYIGVSALLETVAHCLFCYQRWLEYTKLRASEKPMRKEGLVRGIWLAAFVLWHHRLFRELLTQVWLMMLISTVYTTYIHAHLLLLTRWSFRFFCI